MSIGMSEKDLLRLEEQMTSPTPTGHLYLMGGR